MPTVIVSRKHINQFEDTKVQTTKDLYRRLGERLPQQARRGGICALGLSKIDKISEGASIEASELRADFLASEPKKKAVEAEKTVEVPEVPETEKETK